MGTAIDIDIRLFHLTFYKCGSQWVRDILSDPRIVAFSKHSMAAGGIDLQSERWPEIDPGQFASPLYSTGTGEWEIVAKPADRALVVLRDPRDIVVSLVFSVSLSHTPSPTTQLLRDPIAEASPAHRIQIGMFLIAQWAEYLRSWKRGHEFSNVFLTRYETLVADLGGELHRLFDYLHWNVPAAVVDAVAADNLFEVRSGRRPGEENPFSHRRKGIAGDWRNHFGRELGERFETVFPGLLTDLGYEDNDDWWQGLTAAAPSQVSNPELQQARLLAVLEEHESELAAVRVAAEERLRDVELLHAQLSEQTNAANERLAVIQELDRQLREFSGERQGVQHAADERLADILRREASRQELESSVAWRCGYRPVRAIASLFGK